MDGPGFDAIQGFEKFSSKQREERFQRIAGRI